MIFIEKNIVNNIVLTLSESSTISNPNYLFKFEYDFNMEPNEIFFTTADVSNYTERYNLFSLTENATGSTNGGNNVALNLERGQYTYSIYEATASTLSVSATTGVILETGRMVVGNFITVLNNDLNNINTSPQMGIYD